MLGVVKPKFTLENLQQALAFYIRKIPSDFDVINSLIEVTRNSPRADSTDFKSPEELKAAIHKAGIFPEDSPLPQQIAEAFDWVIRRPVRTYSPQDLLKKLESKFESFSSYLYDYLKANRDKFTSLDIDNPANLSRTLIEYVDLCLTSPSIAYIRSCCGNNKISFEQFNQLEQHFKIFSGEDIHYSKARKSLLEFFLTQLTKQAIDVNCNIECFGHLVDPRNNDAPYLDLMSGTHPIRHISSFMSPAHDRQIILTDKSKAVKQLYEIVDELTDGEFSKRVKLLNEDIFNLQDHLEPNSIGTIRLSNVVSFMPRELIYGEINEFDNKASKLVSNLMGLLKPGGKIVFCLRHLDNSNSQDISISDLVSPNVKHGFEPYEDVFKYSAPITYCPHYNFFKILYDKAKKLGYEIKVGHTDVQGNFIENRSGFSHGITQRATELVLIKPGA